MAELTDATRAFLGEPRFATVATNNGNDAPQMSVVWYELQGDILTFSTGTGNRKYRNIEANPRVSVCGGWLPLRGLGRHRDL